MLDDTDGGATVRRISDGKMPVGFGCSRKGVMVQVPLSDLMAMREQARNGCRPRITIGELSRSDEDIVRDIRKMTDDARKGALCYLADKLDTYVGDGM